MTAEQLDPATTVMFGVVGLQMLLFLVIGRVLDDRLLELFKRGKLATPPVPVINLGGLSAQRGLTYVMQLKPDNCPDPGAIRLARWLRLLMLTFALSCVVAAWVFLGAPDLSIPPPDQPDDVRARAS
jgi:hypothetical protein